MKTVPLSNTGVEVSEFCMGTMFFGSRVDEEMSFRLLDHYVEAGGTFLDTANMYHWKVPGFVGGESETVLGRWMKERKNRSQMFVASKVGFEYPGIERGSKAHQIEEECEKSLKRLGLETIDLYYAHRDDRNTPLEETLEAFDRLVRAGKVRFIGASNFYAWRLAAARGLSQQHSWTEFCCIQQRYTYLRPKSGADFDIQLAANDDLLDYCRMRDITLLAYTPLIKGSYIRADRPLPEQYIGPDSDVRLATVKAVAEEIGVTPNQVVLAWLMQTDPPAIPVVGSSQVEHLQENLGALEIQFSDDQMTRLNNASA